MCGIAGILSLAGQLRESDRILAGKMTDVLRHRGPDDRRVLSDGRGILGNTRLKVTDLSESAMLPMVGGNGSLWLSYNGAVTNFRALSEEFGLPKERPLLTRSDAEVVLRLYEKLGEASFSRLSGQFAFCLYDRPGGKALLVRDFYGLRPVFYLAHGGRVYFASEIKALLEVPGWDRRLDHEALWHFFSLAYMPGRRTPFSEVRELPAGHLLEIDLNTGAFLERPYYSLRYEPDDSLTEPEAARKLRGLLSGAVERSLAVDVPAGLTLSGGVDTSSLLALAKELGLSSRLHTFSVVMGENSFDESRYQKLMVEFARPIHHEIRVSPAEGVSQK